MDVYLVWEVFVNEDDDNDEIFLNAVCDSFEAAYNQSLILAKEHSLKEAHSTILGEEMYAWKSDNAAVYIEHRKTVNINEVQID